MSKFTCKEIEFSVYRWFCNLPGEAYRPALLVILNETIIDAQHAALQRATLTLLVMIAQWPGRWPAVVFDILIPTLLALADLPAIGKYQPAAHSTVLDLNAADLALTVLSYMGRRWSWRFTPDRCASIL